MIRNVIFDVGRVLVKFDCESALEQLGVTGSAQKAVRAATEGTKEWDEYDRSEKSDRELLDAMVANAPEYEKEIRLLWEHIGLTIQKFDYASDWIRSLKQNGYRVYILSNYAAHTYRETIAELDFLNDADGAVFSYQVHSIKPEPEIYQALLEKYDLLAEECIFVDDRPDNIEAAEKQGIKGIVFQSCEQAAAQLEQYGVVIKS